MSQRSADPPTFVVEGPPGAGKTTLFSTLVRAFTDRCVFFPEPNPTLTEPTGPIHHGTAAHTLWYLRHERARPAAVAAHAADPATELLLCDRNHLGVLAYCYAIRGSATMPYARARAYYTHHIAPALPATLSTVILLVDVATSLHRRGGQPAHPHLRQWYDPGFLDRLCGFYLDHAAELCPTPPLVIDTTACTRDQVLRIVFAALAQAGITEPPMMLPPTPARLGVAPELTAAHRDAGAEMLLGHPVTELFGYRGGAIQMFELGCLHTARSYTGMWDPIVTASTSAAGTPR